MDIWEYFKSLLKKSEESTATKPFIRETIVRSEEEKADYELWTNTLACRRMLDWLNMQYANFLIQPENLDENIDFLTTPSSNGFVLYFDEMLHNKYDFKHLFEYFKNKTLTFNYKLYMSDRRTYTKEDRVEVIERHYLKPRNVLKKDDATGEFKKVKQRFGNVLIELHFRNDEISTLKYSATCYNDRLYLKGQEFKDLMTILLK